MHGEEKGMDRQMQAIFFVSIAVLFIWTGFGSLWDGGYYSPTSVVLNRFQTDNAAGATANAMEYIASDHRPKDRGVWVLAGLLCILIVKVDGLRTSLERGQRREK